MSEINGFLIDTIYDIPKDFNSGNEKSEEDLKSARKTLRKNIKKIVGYGVTIYYSSKYFSKKENAKSLHNKFFGRYIKEYFDTYIETVNRLDNKKLNSRLSGYLGKVAASQLSSKFFILVLQWEEGGIELWAKDFNMIVTRTFKADGEHIDKDKSIRMTDDLDTIKQKLNKISKDEIGAFCRFFGKYAKTYKATWKSFTENLNEEEFKNILKEILYMNFISNITPYENLFNKDNVHLIRGEIEKKHELEIAYLKLLSFKIWEKYKETYGI